MQDYPEQLFCRTTYLNRAASTTRNQGLNGFLFQVEFCLIKVTATQELDRLFKITLQDKPTQNWVPLNTSEEVLRAGAYLEPSGTSTMDLYGERLLAVIYFPKKAPS